MRTPFTRTRYVALVLLVLPFLAACSGNTSTDRPPLADSVFTAVLVDLHMVDADLALGEAPSRTFDPTSTPPPPNPGSARNAVLAAHGATATEFEETVTWWAQRPEEFLALYEDVLEKINRLSM